MPIDPSGAYSGTGDSCAVSTPGVALGSGVGDAFGVGEVLGGGDAAGVGDVLGSGVGVAVAVGVAGSVGLALGSADGSGASCSGVAVVVAVTAA